MKTWIIDEKKKTTGGKGKKSQTRDQKNLHVKDLKEGLWGGKEGIHRWMGGLGGGHGNKEVERRVGEKEEKNPRKTLTRPL